MKKGKEGVIYNFYKSYIGSKKKCPSLQDVGIEADLSRERSRFYRDRLEEKGYLVRVEFRKNQPILLPHEWIEMHDKKTFKKK